MSELIIPSSLNDGKQFAPLARASSPLPATGPLPTRGSAAASFRRLLCQLDLREFASRWVLQLVAEVASLALVLAHGEAGSRLSWRCPQCGGTLWGNEIRSDPLLTHEHIHCMFCDTELRPAA